VKMKKKEYYFLYNQEQKCDFSFQM